MATLAGGLAHDFNNALSAITSGVELLKMDYPDDKKLHQYVEPMFNSAHRMAHLTSQLLAYVQGGKYRARNVSLSDFIKDTLPSILRNDNPAIRIEKNLADDISNTNVDLTQMQMVLSAIIANAEEAIEGPGCISITTRNEEVDEEFAKSGLGLKPGNYVYLRVDDDGKGMDEEIRSKVFDPFFTTKFQGRGLGLAAAYGIVKNHGGWIYVDSQMDKGTTVHIYLPASDVHEEEVEKPKAELLTGTGTILLIEDEGAVMNVTSAILERLGYRVLKAESGRKAADIVKNFDEAIDMAILDIGLPDMPGERIYRLILEAMPDLKVLICSGYASDGPVKEILNAGAQGFVEKPFSIAELSGKVKEVLEGG